jgi:hypothetical protein
MPRVSVLTGKARSWKERKIASAEQVKLGDDVTTSFVHETSIQHASCNEFQSADTALKLKPKTRDFVTGFANAFLRSASLAPLIRHSRFTSPSAGPPCLLRFL